MASLKMKSLAFVSLLAWMIVKLPAAAQVLINENFDSTANDSVPSGWTPTAPAGTAVGVSNNLSVSSPKSLRFDKTTGTGGNYPQVVAAFNPVTGNLVRVSYKARTTTSNHDPLYVKLRNAATQEVGGLRFTTTSTIQYQLPSGAWSNTSASYAANVWYSLEIEFDMELYTYSAWLNSTLLVQNAAFRTNTKTAASVIIQDRVVSGSGQSYIDDFVVERTLKITTNSSNAIKQETSQSFDSTADDALPTGWTKVEPAGTSVGVATGESVSPSKSLKFTTLTQTPSSSATAIYTFQELYKWGVLLVSFDARTSSTNSDSLYSKLRWGTGGQEIGGIRFNQTGVFAYQLADGTWQATSLKYESNTWYNIVLAFDLEQAAFSAYANGSEIIAYAPFRTGSSNIGHSFIFQDRTFLGTGTSYVDNFKVVHTVPPADLSIAVSASTNYVKAGEPVYYTIAITNHSSRYAGTYAVSNILPSYMTVMSGGTTTGATIQGNTVSWILSGLAGGASTSLTLAATPVYNGSTQEVSAVVTAQVSHAQGDLVSANNSAAAGSVTTVGIPMLGTVALLMIAAAITWAFWRNHRPCSATH